jgi:chemosensory pili system protein ChpB (putative protein-glutamate methylesterase)
MALAQNNRTVRAGLIYQALSLNEHLRVALGNAGVEVIAESPADKLNGSGLDSANIDVFVVNLDPELEDHLDDLTELLDRLNRPVIFNDGAASASLAGWDQARWARHLAAKIKGELDANPPRPEGAESIPAAVVKPKITSAPVKSAAAPKVETAPALSAASIMLVAPEVSSAATVEPTHLASPNPTSSLTADPFAEMSEINLDFDQVPAQSFNAADDTTVMDEFDASIFDLPSNSDSVVAVADSLDPFDSVLQSTSPSAPSEPSANSDKIAGRAQAATVELPVLTNEQLAAPKTTLEWSLEPLDGELASAPPTSGRAVFGAKDVEPIQATIATASVIATMPPPPRVDSTPTDLNDLDFFSELEVSAPSAPATSAAITTQQPAVGADSEISDLDSLFEDLASTESISAAPISSPATALDSLSAQQADDASLDLDFDLDFEVGAPVNSAINAEEAPAFENDDFAELDALFADPPAPTIAAAAISTASVVQHQSGPDRVMVLGASIGGPEAVRSFLSKLKTNTPVAFVLAQHMGAEFLELMTSQLAKASNIPVKLAKPGDSFQAGEVLVVPVNQRFLVDADSTVQFSSLPSDSPYSPSIDQVLFDMADRFGPRCSTIIFSGMASDAIEGAKYVATRGGKVWVQDPSTCVISSMIDGAQAAGVVSFVGAPEQLAEHLTSTIH